MRVSFLWAVPGWACRGRPHARVSTTMGHFSLEKEGGGCVVQSCLHWEFNRLLVAVYGFLFWLIFFLDIFCKHRGVSLSARQKKAFTCWLYVHTPAHWAALRCVDLHIVHFWIYFLTYRLYDSALCCCCWWWCCCSDPVPPQGPLKSRDLTLLSDGRGHLEAKIRSVKCKVTKAYDTFQRDM